jgi:hypothetical protein
VSPDEVIGVEDADDVCVDPNDDVLAGEEPRDAVSGGREDDPAVAVVPKKALKDPRWRLIAASSRRQQDRPNDVRCSARWQGEGRGEPPGAHPPPILSAAD